MAKITHREVIEFYKTADRDLAELVHELGGGILKAKSDLSEKISTNLKKARAARKPKGSAQAQPPAQQGVEAADQAVAVPAAVQAVPADSPIAQARARRAAAGASVPAPATIASTGVESDSEFERPA